MGVQKQGELNYIGKIKEINDGAQTALIDNTYQSNLAYRPEFVSNDYKQGKKVLSFIEDELRNCDEFYISVAFITMGGITPLLQVLKQLEEKNIHGRILTTDYLTFSEPVALDKLAKLRNIELKMFHIDSQTGGFHTKGYIFKKEEIYRIIIGSSNMTLAAITKNREWNTKIVSTENGEMAQEIVGEFYSLWEDKHARDFQDFIEEYRTSYQLVKKQKRIAKSEKITSIEQYILQPNKMQVEFIENLKKLRGEGKERALLLSSTGTGKTYASAFALREENPKRVLFVAHREQIVKQALKSYKNVFGNTKTFGLLSGSAKDYNSDYLFATMQMISKLQVYEEFKPDEFEIIIIDEVHRAGAESYKKIMEYFKPKFWLGMTASPDRTDGFDIYELFDHNIAYEIRLQQALEEDLLCPFHYFGITDLELNGEVFDDSVGVKNFANLVCNARVDYVIEQAKYYGYSGERVRGLIFCRNKKEARELSEQFNIRGYFTEFLCGNDSQQKREDAIARLEQDELKNRLDYIFTVDIFNEGVDIPSINQIIMLRPTESPIIFIQQLGRGLRKAEGKEYVVVIDFIGNYMNNFMIPIALSGDRSYNKDTIRKYVREGSKIIPGSSTLHFDEISKRRVFESIDNATTTKKFLKDKYQLLKNKLGHIPSILEFYEYGEVDPMLFINYAKTYDRFVRMVDSDYKTIFNAEEEATLEFVSVILVNGKRPHELLMLKMLMDYQTVDLEKFKEALERVGGKYRKRDYDSAILVLNKDFINTQSEKKKYEKVIFFETERVQHQQLKRAITFYQKLHKTDFQRELENLIEYGLKKYVNCYSYADEDNLVLYQKYSRKDVCRILNWEKDDSSTIYGYRIKYNTCPIFVTYKKKDDIASSTKYEDHFVNNQIFSWMTRSKVSKTSTEAQELMHYRDNGLKIYLFIKKSDAEGTDFYYMGKVNPVGWQETTIQNDKGQKLSIMNFQMKLEHSVRNDIYEYFTG